MVWVPAETVCGILNLSSAANDRDILVAKGNCGIPEYVDGMISYGGEPTLMARYACLAYDAGARIIGGCCGSTFEHVRAMRDALDRHVRQTQRSANPRPDARQVVAELGEISKGGRAILEGRMNGGYHCGAATPEAPTPEVDLALLLHRRIMGHAQPPGKDR